MVIGVTYSTFYVKIGIKVILLLIQVAMLVISFFLDEEEFVIQLTYFLNIVFLSFAIIETIIYFYRNAETPVHVTTAQGFNLICMITFGLLYFHDIRKQERATACITLTVIYSALNFILVIYSILQKKDIRVRTRTEAVLMSE